MRKLFEGEPGPARDIVAANAGAALVVTGVAENLREGAVMAIQALERGGAKEKLRQMVARQEIAPDR